MKRSALRLCCACLLMTMAVAISAGTIGAVFADSTEKPVEETDGATCVRLVLCADEPSAYILLCAADGTALETLTPDDAGQVRTAPIEPGEYSAATEYGSAAFFLHEDGSVELLRGFGWSDGERLHLTSGQTGTLTVTVRLSGGSDGWLDFVLTDGTLRRREVVSYTARDDSAQCTFAGIPFGLYTLEESGKKQCSVALCPTTPTAALTLAAP